MYRVHIYDSSYDGDALWEEDFNTLEDAKSYCESRHYEIKNTCCEIIPFIDSYEYADVYRLTYDEEYDEYFISDNDYFNPVFTFIPEGATDNPVEYAQKCREIAAEEIENLIINISSDFSDTEINYSYASRSYETFYITVDFGNSIDYYDERIEDFIENDGLCKIRFSTHEAKPNQHRKNDGYIWVDEYTSVDDSNLHRDISDILAESFSIYAEERNEEEEYRLWRENKIGHIMVTEREKPFLR